MRMTEKEYENYCNDRGISYNNKSNKLCNDKILRDIKKKEWENMRNKRIKADSEDSEKIIIEGRLPGLNEIIDAAKQHYSEYSDMKRIYSEIIKIGAVKQSKLKYSKINIEILWVEPNMKRDKDNIAAGVKFILDGLVDAAVISEDGWKQVSNIKHSFDVDNNNPRIEINIFEV